MCLFKFMKLRLNYTRSRPMRRASGRAMRASHSSSNKHAFYMNPFRHQLLSLTECNHMHLPRFNPMAMVADPVLGYRGYI